MYKELGRREFLRRGMGIGLAGGILAGLPSSIRAAVEETESGRTDVVVARGEGIPAVKTALIHLGGIEGFVKPGDRVVIKPNLSFANPPD